MDYLILFIIILPIIAGVGLLLVPNEVFQDRKQLLVVVGMLMVLSAVIAIRIISQPDGSELVLFKLVDDIPVYFVVDNVGRLFAGIVTLIFLMAGFFSFSYMAHERNEKRYYGVYLIIYGVLMGLDFAGNLLTLYLFYEFMTLVSAFLVLHTGTREAVMAGLKYLFYSFCGAYIVLFGIFNFNNYLDTLDFTAGGTLNLEKIAVSGNNEFLLAAAFLMIIGFGIKAGCFPMHAWLSSAHPVAPAPASAFLSGIIAKGGILGIIRVVYFCIGVEFLRGTWVQTAWIILAVITVIMGSALAYKEKLLKKRLAYSTVSNLSYIMLGLAMLNTTAFTGSLLHVIFHAVIKSALFLFAGAVIFTTGKTKVKDLAGLGKKMPMLFWGYTIAALGLIGIPPTSGFVGKWYLGVGSLNAGLGALSWIAPVALLLSALLTAGYLLPVSIKGFLAAPKEEDSPDAYQEPPMLMLVPIWLLAALTLIFGLYPMPLVRFIDGIAATLM